MVEYCKSFLAWCAGHPYLSVPIAFLFAIGLIIWFLMNAHETIGSLRLTINELHEKLGWKAKALIPVGIVLAAGLAFFAPAIGVYFSPGPEITTLPGPALSRDFILRWQYQNPENQQIHYKVRITDKESGKSTTRETNNPYEHIEQHGDLRIWVEAIGRNGARSRSKSVDVELYGDSVERIRHKHELVVAVHSDDDDGVFCFPRQDAPDFDGFDVEFVDAIAARLRKEYGLDSLTVRHSFAKWPDVILEPNKCDVDLAIASITITPEREKEVAFSNPYWQSKLAVITKDAEGKKLFEPEEFKDRKVAVHRATTAESFIGQIQRCFPSMQKPFVADDNPGLFSSLEDDKVDAVIYDFDRTYAQQSEHPEWHFRQIDYNGLNRIRMKLKPEQYGIAFNRLNVQLLGDVNRIIDRHDIDISGMMDKWRRHTRTSQAHAAQASLDSGTR